MGTGHDGIGSSESKAESTPGFNALSEDHVLVLRNWFDSLSWQDPRYNSKFLLKLAALAMGSDDVRRRLLDDTENLVTEIRSHYDRATDVRADPLKGVVLRFWENAPDTLHVVLPPRAEVASELPEPLKDALRSRTSLTRESGHIRDDSADWGNWWDARDRGNHGQDYVADT